MNKLIVNCYNKEIDQIAKNLESLEKQTVNLTAGDLKIVKQRDAIIQFKANRDPEELLIKVDKRYHTEKTNGYEDPEEKKILELQNKCFDKKNIALLGLIQTSEKIEENKKNHVKNLQNLLKRVNLERGFLFKEKLKCIFSTK